MIKKIFTVAVSTAFIAYGASSITKVVKEVLVKKTEEA